MINLKPYIRENSRHKLLFIKNAVNNIEFLDIGKHLSSFIEDSLENRRLSMLADDVLNKIIEEHTIHDTIIGDYIALKNIGILFEPQLQFNLRLKFDSWAKTRLLIVNLEGIIQNNTFFLGDKTNNTYSINLKDITFNTINDEV